MMNSCLKAAAIEPSAIEFHQLHVEFPEEKHLGA